MLIRPRVIPPASAFLEHHKDWCDDHYASFRSPGWGHKWASGLADDRCADYDFFHGVLTADVLPEFLC